jgi:hypothetical protein
MPSKTFTEADYLRAHITLLATEHRPQNPPVLKLKLWAASFFKRWAFSFR